MQARENKGFTLIELMIVIAILGILAAIAVPAYNDSMTKTRRADGQAALMDIMAKEERYFTENNTYTTDLSDLPANSTSGEGFYTITAAPCGAGITSCVQLTATPGSAQSSDGALTLDSRGVKTPASKW
ncbi:MAG TPA: type IV pilin protein [Gammaproteobacteria bacterium]|nr:type IV pilin protein [Gammaproteobacteria bacterium]